MRPTRTQSTFPAPIVEAKKWLDGVTFPADRPLINLSQAAPVAPPPPALCAYIADIVTNRPEVHLYGAVLGLPELRSALADEIAARYGGPVRTEQVAITSGCNEAFAAALSALTTQGDEVLLPTPWYFNHKMYLDMVGVTAIPIPTDATLMPDPQIARARITPRTRAIALVSPNNPCGVEYPPELIAEFYALARDHGVRLILDETYRDFLATEDAPHALFQDPDWDQTLVHLYSFSKTYRLTGHRVGALASSPALLAEIEKFLDTVTICPSQIGQFAALWGMQNLQDWVAGERYEILDRRAAIADGFQPLADKGWKLLGLGAYFAYLEHPFDTSSDALAKHLVQEASLLVLPATMFTPGDDPAGARQLRIAFANADRAGLHETLKRLASVTI